MHNLLRSCVVHIYNLHWQFTNFHFLTLQLEVYVAAKEWQKIDHTFERELKKILANSGHLKGIKDKIGHGTTQRNVNLSARA
jgi:hypothetical protein